MSNIGRMRHRVTLCQQTTASDGMGGQSNDWVELFTTWSHVKTMRVSEAQLAGQIEDRVTHRVTIRHRDGITSAMTLKWENLSLNIIGVINPDGHKRELVLECREGVAL